MMAALTISFTSATRVEISPDPLPCRYSRRPAQLALQLLIGIIRLLPERTPPAPIEGGRQLPLRPGGISLPESAEPVAHRVRNIHAAKILYTPFVPPPDPRTGS